MISLSTGNQGVLGRVRYDPARRRVTFIPDGRALRVGLEHDVAIHPGLASWDGAIATGDDVRLNLIADPPSNAPAPLPNPSLRTDVAPMLARRCATESCHTGSSPVMGLDLSSADSILATAVGVGSRERPSDRSATQSERTDPHWGSMVRIDAGEQAGEGAPAYSYLFYKIVGDGPIIGEPMPPDGEPPLSPDEIALVSDWIARGAADN